MQNLFSAAEQAQKQAVAPLAERMRPLEFADILGQDKVIGEGAMLRSLLEMDAVPSMILWGPPGSGKTTLARVIAGKTSSHFVQLSAVTAGVKELREAVEIARLQARGGKRTILFLDEIHHLNKSQQDALLPYVEDGTIILIGATTENPSFSVNAALLSRARVFVLQGLEPEAILALLQRALADEAHGLGGWRLAAEAEALEFLAERSNGDARAALGALEMAARMTRVKEKQVIDLALVKESLQKQHLLYDKKGEEHYNIISALHKSMRGSNPDAALYWLGRMLEAGEDPLYVARRLLQFASEDVGLADPMALLQANAAWDACKNMGMPECSINLAQAVAYLARAPKSNALYTAYTAVRQDIAEMPADPVPMHLRNAPTKLMKGLGYGKGYKYTPAFKDAAEAAQEYLPERLKGKKYLL